MTRPSSNTSRSRRGIPKNASMARLRRLVDLLALVRDPGRPHPGQRLDALRLAAGNIGPHQVPERAVRARLDQGDERPAAAHGRAVARAPRRRMGLQRVERHRRERRVERRIAVAPDHQVGILLRRVLAGRVDEQHVGRSRARRAAPRDPEGSADPSRRDRRRARRPRAARAAAPASGARRARQSSRLAGGSASATRPIRSSMQAMLRSARGQAGKSTSGFGDLVGADGPRAGGGRDRESRDRRIRL